MRRTGKRIYRRFWISNQIFDSIYRSRDIARSLDTTFGIFGQNRNFVDEYLENGSFFWHAVFAGSSEMFPSRFWPSFIQILSIVFEKKSKNRRFDHIFALYGWSRVFLQNRASSHFTQYQCLTSCKKSEKSLEPFSGKSVHYQPTNNSKSNLNWRWEIIINNNEGDLIGPAPTSVGGPIQPFCGGPSKK